MASIDNVLGQRDIVKHVNKTLFDKTFEVNYSSGGDFSLASYSGTLKIWDYEGGNVIYSVASGGDEVVFSSNTFRLNEVITLPLYGKLYFELEITDGTKTYVIWYGDWFNYYNT